MTSLQILLPPDNILHVLCLFAFFPPPTSPVSAFIDVLQSHYIYGLIRA